MEPAKEQVIFTNKARCRDCYRCVRVCPVKAIRVEKDQACVDAQRCISCGTCVRECPQEAKVYREDIDQAEALLKEHALVAVSLAPSFAGIFEPWAYARIPSALRRLGFKYVAETAIGAYLSARGTVPVLVQEERCHICTACPAVVNYVEKYLPEKISALVPVVSPMMAHAKHIKKTRGPEWKVVFIGPCAAKKAEAERPELSGLVDCVLTFEELDEWIDRRGIDLRSCEESAFDELPYGEARIFPLEGGSLETANIPVQTIDTKIIALSGFGEVKESLGASINGGCVIEPLWCPHGCLNGPGISKKGNIFERRVRLKDYACSGRPKADEEPGFVDLTTTFAPSPLGDVKQVAEEDIRQVLEKAGKARPENQLNCGACGYASCREQATAVAAGMAEVEMCIPYMRRLAEQRSDRIMETSPNGIVILGQDLKIIHMNPAFSQMFGAGPSAVGQHISRFFDPHPFELVVSGQREVYDEVHLSSQGVMVIRGIVYALRREHQYVGMFINMTTSSLNAQRLQEIKDETLQQARELHKHQIAMALNFANFLGVHTAKGEQLVQKLMQAVERQEIARDKAED